MSLEEKIAQLRSAWVFELLDGLAFSEQKAARVMGHGIGQMTRIGGASNLRPADSARLANTIQRWLVEHTRLGIPAMVHEECCSGYMALSATCFPQAIGVASTWNPALVEQMTGVIRAQMRAVGGHHALAPVLDVTRDPRWGRTSEGFGEDPYLVSQIAGTLVRAYQGERLSAADSVMASVKHFALYGAVEGGRDCNVVDMSPQRMYQDYLPPYRAAIAAGAGAVMVSLHSINGVPATANKCLLQDLLRGQWG
jgi:beta-glucosidase